MSHCAILNLYSYIGLSKYDIWPLVLPGTLRGDRPRFTNLFISRMSNEVSCTFFGVRCSHFLFLRPHSRKEIIMADKTTDKTPSPINNPKLRDSNSKLIFSDNILSSQFLRDYADMEILRYIQPEDIEDVSERYVPLYSTERDSDTVKK